MPVDGTYGRLSAHKQRMNDMRSKRREKTENTSRSTMFNNPELIKNKPINSKNLEEFRTRFHREHYLKKRKELIFSVLLILGAIIISVLMIRWAIGKF